MGRRVLDVGASTGGFTDCALQRGARDSIAVDVGYGTLSWSLRSDPRVTVMERTNARALTAAMLPHVPDLATIDVSFISLAKVLGAVLGCLAPGYDALAMIKPQFEVGRGKVGKGGVVRDADTRRDALIAVGEAALSLGAAVLGYYSSGLPGPKGNQETFIWLADPARVQSESERDRVVLPTGHADAGEGAATAAAQTDAASAQNEALERLAREVEP
jgi:23S rRNA (cytidine1920-2'-O)/16S rRNA (cytidine1409-2'-O)-methyltransferase